MLSALSIVLAVASGALAATPQGFQPAVQASLLVAYGDAAAMDGAVVAKQATQSEPSIGTLSKLDGTSFAVMMIDLDIPTNSPPQTDTLLHWMRLNMTQNAAATKMTTASGQMNAFMLQSSGEADAASYLGPSPPPRAPLTHRYTQLLVDTSDASADSLAALKTAAKTRTGFNAMQVLTDAGLADKAVAGNFFKVTATGVKVTARASNSTLGGGSGGTGSSNPPSQTSIFPGAAASQRASALLSGIAVVGAVFWTL
ncbi:PEBP-like protein [Xylariomycetidae sp. FL0641]|nr:PEBP-like protein [Xylariomycetidae sp. FL0641]